MRDDALFEVIWSSLLKTYGAGAARKLAELWEGGRLLIARSSKGSPRVVKAITDSEAFDLAYYNPVTGVLTLSERGALMIFPLLDRHHKRVYVSRRDFCERARGSVLAPIVRGITEDVRPGDEVFVVDEDDNLLGIGRSVVSWADLQSMSRGEVVRLRRKVGC